MSLFTIPSAIIRINIGGTIIGVGAAITVATAPMLGISIPLSVISALKREKNHAIHKETESTTNIVDSALALGDLVSDAIVNAAAPLHYGITTIRLGVNVIRGG